MSGNKREQIVCAAIKMRWVGALNLKHCELLCGINHTQIRRSMFYQEKKCGEWQESFFHEKGFMTNKGRFVDPKNAMKLAINANQIAALVEAEEEWIEERSRLRIIPSIITASILPKYIKFYELKKAYMSRDLMPEDLY